MPRPRNPDAKPHLVRLSGRRAWYIRWNEPGGRSQTISTGVEDESEARLVLADFNVRRNAPPPAPTISWFLEQRAKAFQTDGPKGKRTEPRVASFHRQLTAFFGDYRPDQLSESLMRDYLSRRPPTSGRREMEELRASIPEKLRPCDFPLPAPRPPRERFLNKEEARALLDNATSFHTKIFILLGMTTGQRAGAILGLTWDRVLWSSGVIDFRDPDRGENR